MSLYIRFRPVNSMGPSPGNPFEEERRRPSECPKCEGKGLPGHCPICRKLPSILPLSRHI